jgi:hypothetical protein
MDSPVGFAIANEPCGLALRVHRPAHTPGLRLDTLRVPTALAGADAVPTRPRATNQRVLVFDEERSGAEKEPESKEAGGVCRVAARSEVWA